MNKIKFSVYQKLVTIIMSIVVGCKFMKDINEKLGTEKLSAKLVTNIAAGEMDAVELFHFYNKRQTIEAFFKMVKNVYSIKNLRTTSFYGIYGFLWLVFLTHNLIVWFKATTLHNTELKDAGVRVLVKKIGNIKGFVKRTVDKIEVNISSLTRLSKIIAYALCKPQYEQVRFNI